MRELTLSHSHSVTLYESIFELPEVRRLEFNCYLAQEMGIGADVPSLHRHFSSVTNFLASGQPAEAADELAQLLFNVQFMLEKFGPQSLSFCVLVAQVDGIPTADYTETGLTALRDRLSSYGLTAGQVETEVATVKKNFRPN